MTQSNQNHPEQSLESNSAEGPDSKLPSEIPENSATTPDQPAFGWSAYAERVNGRFAMIGFIAILLIEAFSHGSFLKWAGFLS